MPVVSVQKISYELGWKWGTYGMAGKLGESFEVKNVSRARSWSRQFKTRKLAMVQLLEQGFLPTLPYTDDLQEVVNSKVVTVRGLMYYNSPDSNYVYSFVPTYNRVSVDLLSSRMNDLVVRVRSQLQSRISGNGTNLVVSAAEAKQTIGMIGETAGKLYTAYRHVRHGNFRAAATALGLAKVPSRVGKYKRPDENWLEYRYGWRLVVYDLSSLMKTLWDSLRTRPPLLRVTARAVAQSNNTSSWGRYDVVTPNGLRAGSFAVTKTFEETLEARGGYVYELENVATANQQSFGLANPFLWAWELIPYSFVLDFVANIGTCLEGLTAFIGKRWKDGWINRAWQTSVLYRWTNPVKGSDVLTFEAPKNVSFGPQLERRFSRKQENFTPASLLISVDLGLPRVLDLISLVTAPKRDVRN